MKCLNIALALTSAALIASLASAQQKRTNPNSESTIFRADNESFSPPVPIPPNVLAKLIKTPTGKMGWEFASVRQKPNLADLFRAVDVQLNASGEPAIVVGGLGWMSGADNDWFWIVRSPHYQPKVILFCGANSLELLHSSLEGYRDVRCTWSSPSETITRLYRYKAGRYRLEQEKDSENRLPSK